MHLKKKHIKRLPKGFLIFFGWWEKALFLRDSPISFEGEGMIQQSFVVLVSTWIFPFVCKMCAFSPGKKTKQTSKKAYNFDFLPKKIGKIQVSIKEHFFLQVFSHKKNIHPERFWVSARSKLTPLLGFASGLHWGSIQDSPRSQGLSNGGISPFSLRFTVDKKNYLSFLLGKGTRIYYQFSGFPVLQMFKAGPKVFLSILFMKVSTLESYG